MKLLIIEDEPAMVQNLTDSLSREEFVVEAAQDYSTAINKISAFNYDCIILDISLPDGNGLEILRHIKKNDLSGSIIIVSARDSLDDKLTGLDLGADDYLPKPFHMSELLARLRAVLRRNNFKGKKCISMGNIQMDPAERHLHIEQQKVKLNRKEYNILLFLLTNKNRLVSKSALAEHVWGDYIDQSDSFDFIYAQIKNLRKKLTDNNATVEIKAVYGIGYKLITP